MHCITGSVAGVMGRSHSVCSDANSRACGSSQWQTRTTAQGGPGMRCPCTRRRSGRDAVCLWLCASSQRNEFCVWVNQMPNLLGSVGAGYPLSPAARLDPGSWQLCSVSQGVHQLLYTAVICCSTQRAATRGHSGTAARGLMEYRSGVDAWSLSAGLIKYAARSEAYGEISLQSAITG